MSASTSRKIDPETLVELWVDEGVTDTKALAEYFGCTTRSILRAVLAAGLREKQPRLALSKEQVEWIRQARAEGVFVDWIGETLGVGHTVLDRISDPTPGHREEVASTWQQIRRNPTLLALHREFMPKKRIP